MTPERLNEIRGRSNSTGYLVWQYFFYNQDVGDLLKYIDELKADLENEQNAYANLKTVLLEANRLTPEEIQSRWGSR